MNNNDKEEAQVTEKKLLENFSKNLYDAMEKADYNQTSLADASGINRSLLNHYLSGKKMPTLRNIALLCDTLNIDLGYLFGAYKEKNSDVKIVCDITGLSADVAEKIINYSEKDTHTLNELLSNELLSNLIKELYAYSRSHNKVMRIQNIQSVIYDMKSEYNFNGSDIYKMNILNTFTKIIESIYNKRVDSEEQFKNYIISNEIKRVKKEIEENISNETSSNSLKEYLKWLNSVNKGLENFYIEDNNGEQLIDKIPNNPIYFTESTTGKKCKVIGDLSKDNFLHFLAENNISLD